MSRTRYCLKTGPSMVCTTTEGAGCDTDDDSSCSCLVKRSTPRYRCWPVAADVEMRITWHGRPCRIRMSPRRMWWHGIVTVLGVTSALTDERDETRGDASRTSST